MVLSGKAKSHQLLHLDYYAIRFSSSSGKARAGWSQILQLVCRLYNVNVILLREYTRVVSEKKEFKEALMRYVSEYHSDVEEIFQELRMFKILWSKVGNGFVVMS